MRIRASLLILTLLAIGLPAYASDWYPIDTGRFWVYTSPGGTSYSATIDASELFVGAIVQPLHWDSGVRELLSEDGAGHVYLHGQDGADGSYVVYDPPVLRMDSDLTPGLGWEATAEVIGYSVSGVELFRGQLHMTFDVIAIGSVDVPAGTFVAAEVLQTIETTISPAGTSAPYCAALGSSAPLGVYTFHEVYGDGVGWIRRTDDTGLVFELMSYGPTPLPTRETTWGGVKALFRD